MNFVELIAPHKIITTDNVRVGYKTYMDSAALLQVVTTYSLPKIGDYYDEDNKDLVLWRIEEGYVTGTLYKEFVCTYKQIDSNKCDEIRKRKIENSIQELEV